MEGKKILVVDDDEGTRHIASFYLEEDEYRPITAANGQEALEILARQPVDLILSDHIMPEMDGMELLKRIRVAYGNIPFIIMTAYGSIEGAVVMIREGANDYIQKPLDPDELKITIKRSLDIHRLGQENRRLKGYFRGKYDFQNIITESPQMRNILRMAERVSGSPETTVAIYGESGTGKEVLARAIHFAGDGQQDRFIAVNCAGIPSGLMESELFGHVKGAFTGADRDRQGRFELAQGGTILLDEIGDMPLDLQTKLLRVLENRSFEKIGSEKKISLEARVIVATHRNLEDLVEEGKFREDLYYRVNAFPITLPPLRERKEDIPILADHFLNQFRNHIGKRICGISGAAIDILSGCHWPGNIRELKNCIERATILADSDFIGPEQLILGNDPQKSKRPEGPGKISIDISLDSEDFSLNRIIDRVLQIALERCDNNISHAAKFLKVDRKMFYRRR